MKSKLLTLVFCVFLLSGCDITYNLDISKNTIKETTKIIESNEERFENDEMSNIFYDNYSIIDIALFEQDNIANPEENATFKKIDGIKYYNKKTVNNGIGYIYEGKFNHKNFNDSSILTYGAPLHKYEISDNVLKIKTEKLKMLFNQFPTLDNIKINIKVNDYAVVENNADSKKNNTYTWKITRDNYTKKNVILNLNNKTFSKVIYNDILSIGNNAYNLLILFPFIIIIVLIALLIYKKIITKKEQANKF